MKTMKILFAAAALALLTACNSDDSPIEDVEQRVPVRLTCSTFDVTESRAAQDLNNGVFDADESVKVRISNTGVGSWTDYTYTTGSAGAMTAPTPAPYYPAGDQNIDIVAYYPATAGTSFTVAADQTADADYKASDLMFASVTDQAKQTEAVNMAFAHKMVKFCVNVTAGAGITSINGVQLLNIKPTVTFDQATGTVGEATGSATSITMSNGGAAVIPAQTLSGNFLQIATDKGTATYSLTSKAFQAGKSYTLNVTVAAVSIGIITQISNWTESSNCTVEVKNRKAAAAAFTRGSTAEVGKIVGADGEIYSTVSEAVNAGTDAIGIVAYTEGEHGLILALQDALPYDVCWLSYLKWDGSSYSVAYDYFVNYFGSESGLALAAALQYGNSIDEYECYGRRFTQYMVYSPVKIPPVDACVNYAPTTSGFAAAGNWFLPSLGEWNLMVKALVTKAGGTASDFTKERNNNMASSVYGSLITDAGGTGLRLGYWSSSEYNSKKAWSVSIQGGCVEDRGKEFFENVRAALKY